MKCFSYPTIRMVSSTWIASTEHFNKIFAIISIITGFDCYDLAIYLRIYVLTSFRQIFARTDYNCCGQYTRKCRIADSAKDGRSFGPEFTRSYGNTRTLQEPAQSSAQSDTFMAKRSIQSYSNKAFAFCIDFILV